jgi:hypothetical protein
MPSENRDPLFRIMRVNSPRRSRLNEAIVPQLGRDEVKIGPPDSTVTTRKFVVRGTLASAKGVRPMNNAIRSEDIEPVEGEDANLAAVSDVEEGIREFVRNDIAYLRRPVAVSAPEATLDPGAEATVNNVNSLIHRVAGTSVSEIEKLISELEAVRDLLHAEGQRVQREISGYAQLSQAAMKSTRMIADNVQQWKRAADGLRNG